VEGVKAREGERTRTVVSDFHGLLQVGGHKCVSESHVESRPDLGVRATDEIEEAGGREEGREGGVDFRFWKEEGRNAVLILMASTKQT